MKKTVIIKKNYEFKSFFKKGEYFSGKYLEIFISKNKLKNNRLGIVISKKVGNSVVRHRLRRLIVESYTYLEDKILSNIDVLICFKKKVEFDKNLSFFNIKDDLDNIFRKANVVINEENNAFDDKNI